VRLIVARGVLVGRESPTIGGMKSFTGRAAVLFALLSAAACSPDGSGTTSAAGPGAGGAGGGDGDGGSEGQGAGPASTASTSTGPGSTASSGTGQGGEGQGGEGQGGEGTTTSSGGGQGGEGQGGDAVASSSSGGDDTDDDGDGFTENQGDCDDGDAGVSPDAPEICNQADDDCDAMTDEGYDVDGDQFTSCGSDCDDSRADAYPGAPELENGLDDDCNGVADEPFTDDDVDGWTEAEGDCDDDDVLVNPGAIEFVGNDVDDDCDGTTDEALVPCDGGLDPNDPLHYARAIGLCNGEVLGAALPNGVVASRTIVSSYGSYGQALNVPAEGSSVVLLSSGRADSTNKDVGFQHDEDGNRFNCIDIAHPAENSDPGDCGFADPSTVCDPVELSLTLRVPTNALSFSYQFQFFSSEYPTFRCTEYDDTFLALLASQAFTGNISFDLDGDVVSVNNGFFDVCNDDDPNINGGPPNFCDPSPTPATALDGTGYFPFTGGDSIGAGSTNVLTTTSPVVPGETITLRFVIFDEGDDILDSSVLIDNFQWLLEPSDGPGTKD
jgi:hypothetical protein